MPGEHSQGNQNPGGDGSGNGSGNGNGEGSGTPPATPPTTPPASNSGAEFDPTALTQEQINQVLEKNPEVWKTERLAKLREKSSKFDKLESEKAQAEQKALEEQGKFKELSEKQTATIAELQGQLKNATINQALTNKLSPLGVVDLEGALALIDRSKIEVGEDGAVTGIDEAIEALKTGKSYLFNTSNGNGQPPQVGGPTNPGNGTGQGGPAKFKRSQLRDPAFYNANRDEILKAQAAGLIEDDLTR